MLAPVELVEALRRREVDTGVLLAQSATLDGATEIAFRRLGALPIGALVPVDHRLAGRGTISIDEIAGDTLIVFDRHLATIYDVALAICRERGFVPARIEEVDRVETILGLVAAGEGVSIVPTLYETLGYPGVTYVTLDPQPEPFATAVTWSAGSTSALTAAFVDTCERIATAG